MNLNQAQLESAFLIIINGLNKQHLSAHLKTRWTRAFEKAKDRLIEQPYFAWQPERLLIVSVPKESKSEIGCRFYEANESACRRVDRTGLCQAFYEGVPCWHRAAFLLLKIYIGEGAITQSGKNRIQPPFPQKVSTKVDIAG